MPKISKEKTTADEQLTNIILKNGCEIMRPLCFLEVSWEYELGGMHISTFMRKKLHFTLEWK